MTLHPEFRSYLDVLNPIIAENARNGVQATPAGARAALAGLNQFALPAVPVAQIADATVHTAQATVPVRIYVPARDADAPRDAVLFVHGGGHVAGDLDVYDHQARRLAAATGAPVVAVDYRLAPEHRYPAGLNDVYAVLQRLPQLLAEAGVVSSGRIHAFGDSGGGAKLASLAQRVAAGSWTSPIDRQVLLYPSLDYTLSGASVQEFGTGYFLEAERVRWYFDNYFPAGTDRAAASPLGGPYASALPETLVIAAEYDVLRSEAELYVERLREAGGTAHFLLVPGAIHAFAFFEDKVPELIERLYAVSGEFLTTGRAPAAW